MSRLELPVCTIDLDQHVVLRDGRAVALTAIEAKLIGWFAANAGRTVSRDELLQQVWGYRPGIESRTVQSTIHRVREKVEADPSDPVVLRTVYGAGYRFDPPPPEDDGLIGRSAALRQVEDALASARLVTIAGPGGVGKTTLARRVAASRRGSVFCTISAARTADELVRVVASALGMELPAGPVAERARAVAELAEGVPLLVLDNLEQLDAGAHAVIDAWHPAPFAILATSRHVRGLAREVVVDLQPLEEPAAVRLFEVRARAARPDVGFGDPADVRAIVDELDRLPLAIELVAARASLLGISELRQRVVAGRLQVGSGPDRRTSLDLALRWSWDLLEPAEQAVLAQIATFATPFTLDAAEAVARGDGDLVGILDGLRHKALLRADNHASVTRFDLLGTVRRFAAARLAERPDAAEVAIRHARWIVDRGWRLGGLAPGGRDAAAAAADLPEVTAALGRAAAFDGDTHARLAIVAFRSQGIGAGDAVAAAVARGDVVGTVRGHLLGVHAHVLRIRGDADGAARTLDAAFSAAGDDPAVLSHLYTFRTGQLIARGAWEAADGCARLAEEQALQGGLTVARLTALANRAAIAWYSGNPSATARFEEVQELAERSGDDIALVEALANHGGLHVDAGRLDRALPLLLRAVQVAERSPGPRRLGTSLNNLAALYREQGRLDEAEETFRRAIEHMRRALRVEPAVARLNLGWIALERGRVDEAAAAASEGIDVLGRHQPHFVVEARILAAAAAQVRGWGAFARDHYDAAIAGISASDRRRPRLIARRAVLEPSGARAALLDARGACEAAGWAVEAAEIDMLLGLVDVAEGRPEAARDRITAAGAPVWSADVRFAIRLVLSALGG